MSVGAVTLENPLVIGAAYLGARPAPIQPGTTHSAALAANFRISFAIPAKLLRSIEK
jgi:hypothetical protein